MFLAYRQTVDMFPVYSKSVDMFLTPFFANKHGGDDYQFHFLKPCGDGRIIEPNSDERQQLRRPNDGLPEQYYDRSAQWGKAHFRLPV